MFTRSPLKNALIGFLGVAGLAAAQPKEWTDDFTTVTTYDSASLLAPCYGGPPTKYTMIDVVTSGGDAFNLRSWSGNEKLIVTDRNLNLTICSDGLCSDLSFRPLNMTVLGRLGLQLGCPGEPPLSTTSDPFTSMDLCIYGGVEFSHWQIRRNNNIPDEPFGADGVPGEPGVDDDNDGTIDGADESPNLRSTVVNGGYGNIDGTGFEAGVDNAPGDAGVDDNSNGIIDDYGETGWLGTDDGDDRPGANAWMVWMRLNILNNTGIYLELNPTRETRGMFNIVEVRLGETFIGDTLSLAQADEITDGFYNPETHYNYSFCVSGTCYGASLWTLRDVANPNEVLGPVVATRVEHQHPNSNIVAFGNGVTRLRLPDGPGLPPQPWPIRNTYTRQNVWRVNANFTHKFWVVSGDSDVYYPSVTPDLDNDRDVDANDYFTFSNCFNGSLNPPQPICLNLDADFDEDGDVDANDFLTFSNCYAGSLTKPKPICFPPDLTTCIDEASGSGGGSLLAQSAVQIDPFLFDGMTPVEEFWYFYTPTCSGDATLALCDATGQGRSVEGIHFAFFDGTAEEATVVTVTACGQAATETVPMVAGQTVYLLVYRDAGAESLDGFTLSVMCGP